MKKIAMAVMTVVSVLVLLWVAASWVDIVADNCEPNPTHSEYNFFVKATE